MRFFIYLILFLYIFIKISSSNYIQCTSQCNQITVSFLQPLILPIDCQDNNNNNNNLRNSYDYALICFINYRIDYNAKQIYINFEASNDTNIFKEQNQSEVLIQSLWLGFNQESNQPNIADRKYSCNTKNDCARLFYLNTIEYLIKDGKLKLDEINSKLFNQTKPLRLRCINSTQTSNRSITRCSYGLCYAHNIDKKQYCTSDNSAMLFSQIEYYLPTSLANKVELVEYKCNTDLCNKNAMIKMIKNILLNYTNGNDNYFIGTNIEQKSSTIHQTVSYCLIILSLINLQFLY